MVNPFLTNTCLQNLTKRVELPKEKKDILLKKIPYLNAEERMKVFVFLKNVYVLDLEEKRVMEKLKERQQQNKAKNQRK